MKHGVAFRKFSRTSSHRMLMLRNLVTSLIQHEQVKTTLPKARDTARLAEKIITLGKRGTHPAWKKAAGFLLLPSLTPKVFETLAARYASRPGGYTRIHKFGNRPGDNAPHAVLELVDGPRDLKFEMAARATGWDVLSSRLQSQSARALVKDGVQGIDETVKRELSEGVKGVLRERTRWNVVKTLRYRSAEDAKRFGEKVQEHVDTLLARPVAIKALREHSEKESAESDQQHFRSIKDYKLKAGDTIPGAAGSTLRRAQGDLGWAPGRKVRWFERRKLGIDRPLTWEQV
ncbi:mitochondrial ribosomal protein L17 [Multifurca ochricompacta]|uniref:Mitochondrial ribosomal protein L17 n=1 Tax=Multifurca ochricompacta TaxID=376703 RepID=A0AAD4QQL5_9AGAM|nr:mitochondrial ribosomal protein L17 [Multifurca ochricompacta]